jgi:hypothetical protein
VSAFIGGSNYFLYRASTVFSSMRASFEVAVPLVRQRFDMTVDAPYDFMRRSTWTAARTGRRARRVCFQAASMKRPTVSRAAPA